ncbi:MAG: oligosaccharide flippase family protein [Draconibacterium sp.]
MGIIIKQSIKGSIWSYLGVGLGFVTTVYLFPRYLDTDTIGLFGLLVAYAVLFSQFVSLGINGVTAKLFPYFRNKENGHNGYLFISSMVLVVGSIIFLAIFSFFSPVLVESNLEKSKLFADYLYLIVPLTILTAFFTFFDVYNKLLYDAVFGTFLQEFLQRVFILIITLFFVFRLLTLNQLIIAYAIVVSLKTFIFFIHLLGKKEIDFRPRLDFIGKDLRNEMISVSAFSILAGFGSTVVFNIDKIIVNQMIDLGSTGVYTIAFYFGALVVIPSRPLLKISGTIIAESWKRNDLKEIDTIYQKTCLNQFIIGGLIFIGIWANVGNILKMLGPGYVNGKWVIFFIGLGYLIDMVTGANNQIISFSKYYKTMLWFVIVLIVLVIITNLIFIPIWGITGAAIASAVSMLINNLMRYIFIYRKFHFQPFNYRFLLIALSLVIAYFSSRLIPEMELISDIIVRSSLITFVFGALIITFGVSTDINSMFRNIINRFK